MLLIKHNNWAGCLQFRRQPFCGAPSVQSEERSDRIVRELRRRVDPSTHRGYHHQFRIGEVEMVDDVVRHGERGIFGLTVGILVGQEVFWQEGPVVILEVRLIERERVLGVVPVSALTYHD